VFGGLRAPGFVLINSIRTADELGLADLVTQVGAAQIRCVPATDLARRHIGRPLPNVCLLGALAALTGQVARSSIETAVRERFPERIATANVVALDAAYEHVRASMTEATSA
jgi:pyruvate ferredoxin oxidoreductase gamma subunit